MNQKKIEYFIPPILEPAESCMYLEDFRIYPKIITQKNKKI